MTLQSFGDERAQRYCKALKRCLYARAQEIIPILFFLHREDLIDCSVIDLASGTGYLSDVLEPLVKKVIRVDRSPAMFVRSQIPFNPIYADLNEVHRELEGTHVDVITCLAALHHLIQMRDDEVDSALSEEYQFQAIENWTKLLKPGGKLVLVDVCLPDLSAPTNRQAPVSLLLEQYYQSRREDLRSWRFPVDANLLSFVEHASPEYFANRPLRRFMDGGETISLTEILDMQYLQRPFVADKMLVVDFFDDVVANFSIDGHLAYFPRERHLSSALEAMGLTNILVTCLPTPWMFKSEEEAVWFIRELFALGTEPASEPADLVGKPEYTRIKQYIQTYLGLYQKDDITYVNWQLMFAVAEKR